MYVVVQVVATKPIWMKLVTDIVQDPDDSEHALPTLKKTK